MLSFQFTVLHLFVLVIIFIFSKKIECNSINNYWKLAIIPIIVFGLEEGLRWGREIDWCLYYYSYDNMMHNSQSEFEPLFHLLIGTFAYMELPYCAFITFCSLLLIFSFFFFFKPYKNNLSYIFIFLIPMVAPFAINVIRWYVAFSFLLIGLRYHLDNKKYKSYIFYIAAFLSHYAIVFGIIIMVIIRHFSNKVIMSPIKVISGSIILLIISSLILPYTEYIFHLFNNVDRFSHYLEDTSQWISSDNNYISILMQTLKFMPLYISIYYIYNSEMNNKNACFFYNLTSIGILLWSIGLGLELFLRYKVLFDPFSCIMIAYTITLLKHREKTFFKRLVYSILLSFLFIQIYQFIRPYENDLYNGYVWNKQTDPMIILGSYKDW